MFLSAIHAEVRPETDATPRSEAALGHVRLSREQIRDGQHRLAGNCDRSQSIADCAMLQPRQHRPASCAHWYSATHTGGQASVNASRNHCRRVTHSARCSTSRTFPPSGRQSPFKRRHLLTASAAEAAREGEAHAAAAGASEASTSEQASGEAAAEEKLAFSAAAARFSRTNGSAVPSVSARPGCGAAADSGGGGDSVRTGAGAASVPQAESWLYSRHDRDIWGLAVPALFRCLGFRALISHCTP